VARNRATRPRRDQTAERVRNPESGRRWLGKPARNDRRSSFRWKATNLRKASSIPWCEPAFHHRRSRRRERRTSVDVIARTPRFVRKHGRERRPGRVSSNRRLRWWIGIRWSECRLRVGPCSGHVAVFGCATRWLRTMCVASVTHTGRAFALTAFEAAESDRCQQGVRVRSYVRLTHLMRLSGRGRSGPAPIVRAVVSERVGVSDASRLSTGWLRFGGPVGRGFGSTHAQAASAKGGCGEQDGSCRSWPVTVALPITSLNRRRGLRSGSGVDGSDCVSRGGLFGARRRIG
jgi:hypothetical protein